MTVRARIDPLVTIESYEGGLYSSKMMQLTKDEWGKMSKSARKRRELKVFYEENDNLIIPTSSGYIRIRF
jgi:hypothetical protein